MSGSDRCCSGSPSNTRTPNKSDRAPSLRSIVYLFLYKIQVIKLSILILNKLLLEILWDTLFLIINYTLYFQLFLFSNCLIPGSWYRLGDNKIIYTKIISCQDKQIDTQQIPKERCYRVNSSTLFLDTGRFRYCTWPGSLFFRTTGDDFWQF